MAQYVVAAPKVENINSGWLSSEKLAAPKEDNIHFCFCRQAFSQKHGLAVGKSQQVGEHPKPGAQRVLLADVPVDQQPDFF